MNQVVEAEPEGISHFNLNTKLRKIPDSEYLYVVWKDISQDRGNRCELMFH